MANVVQWSVARFYDELGRLDRAGRAAITRLNDQKLELQRRYTAARNAGNENAMKFLRDLIHRNSVLRMSANEYVGKFNELVARSSSILRGAGLAVPKTVGLGVVPAMLVIVPATVVTTALILWGIVNRMTEGAVKIADALKSQGPELLATINDKEQPPEVRAAAAKAYEKLVGAADDADDWTKMVLPALGLVALIALGPQLLRMVPQRRRAAA